MFRISTRLFMVSVLAITIFAGTLLPAQPALARDNCKEVLKAAAKGGWEVTTVYNLNHKEYVKWTAKMLAGGTGAVAAIATVVHELIKAVDNVELAELLGKTLLDLVNGKKGKTINYADADYKLMLVTCQHWHNEKVPYCEPRGLRTKCGMRLTPIGSRVA